MTCYTTRVNGDDSFLLKIERITSKVRWASGVRPTQFSVGVSEYLEFNCIDTHDGFKYELTKGFKAYYDIIPQNSMLSKLSKL